MDDERATDALSGSRDDPLEGIENLLFGALDLQKSESAVFVHDAAFSSLVEPLANVARRHQVDLSFEAIEHDGIQPLNPAAKEILLGKVHGVILFGLVHNIWHTPERKRAKYDLGKRLASLVCSPADIGGGAARVDLGELMEVARAVSSFLTPGATLRVTTPAGSDFTSTIEKPFCEDGNYRTAGSGGDFPSGESGFGPMLKSVNGVVVYDVKVQHIGVLAEPLVLRVDGDEIVETTGPNAGGFSQICRDRGNIIKFISEISIGLNPAGALTSSPEFIPEEKMYGTLHCGHGGNASYGSRTGPHLDGVMRDPTVIVDGVLIMEDGKLVPGLLADHSNKWLNQH